MAFRNLIYLFTILASLALILAQDTSTTPAPDSTDSPSSSSSPSDSSPPTDSSPPPDSSSRPPHHHGSGLFGNLPFNLGNFQFPQFPNFPFFSGSRQKRSPQPDTEEQTDRLFFSLLSRQLTSCTYSTEPGSSCAACHVVRRCYPGNIGTLRTCSGLFPYCNSGRCSIYPGAKCSATTSSTSSTSSTSTTSTTSTTTASTTTAATG